uniref:C-type lectin domain-containing protein n=1 Tax=Salarias fasciatus TaxID=181472 RepID=A0A672FN56_SALFA
MEIQTLLLFFASIFCAEVEGEVGTHYYISKAMNWKDAQTHCRKYYTDLSAINDQKDTEKILKAAEGQTMEKYTWIGLYRDPTNATRWMWSGGGYVTYTNWAIGLPDNYLNREGRGMMFSNGQWNDGHEIWYFPFFCIKISGLKHEKKTWEEALEHCREEHSDLISIASETDRLLAQTEMQRNDLTEHVWIGLRFLADQWLWVDGKTMVYKAWPQGGDEDHQCPTWRRCGENRFKMYCFILTMLLQNLKGLVNRKYRTK